MKAIVFTEYGLDRLQIKEVAKPTPKNDDVLVKVHASSINSWDWEFQNGKIIYQDRCAIVFHYDEPQSVIVPSEEIS